MSKQSINEVLAANLAHFMVAQRLTQTALAGKAGVGQTTVGLYLNPTRRQVGARGKAPSAKLSEVESLANALGVQVWELLRPLTAAQRSAYQSIEAAFLALNPAELRDDQENGRKAA